MPFTENRLQNCRCHRPEKGPRPARLHATSPKTGPGAVWGELIRKRANLDARSAPDRHLSAQNVTCHQGPKLGPSERGYMQITEFEPLSHHRKLPNLGLHRMRDTKRLFGGPDATRQVTSAVHGHVEEVANTVAIESTVCGFPLRHPYARDGEFPPCHGHQPLSTSS